MSGRFRALLGALAVVPLALVGIPGNATADGSGDTAILVAVSDCAAPHPGDAQCYAEHLVRRTVSARAARGQVRASSFAFGNGPAGGYSPGELAKVYGQNAGASSASSHVVAIVDAYRSPKALRDLNTFDRRYHLPAESSSTFRVVGQDGTKAGIPRKADKGWAGEVDLDLQAVRGLCHRCPILLVESDSSAFADFAAAVSSAGAYQWKRTGKSTLPVNIISNSYGAPEDPSIINALAPAYDQPGKAILASSGDHGWFGWDVFNNTEDTGNAASYPAVLDTVVGVGGTALKLNRSGGRASETTWNRNGNSDTKGLYYRRSFGAAGSGCSEYVDAPSFQGDAPGYSTLGCTPGKRSSVDVAALADPYTGYDVYTGGTWQTYGGTSLASPLVAAMWAVAGGPGGTPYPAANLYAHLGSRAFYDLKVGGNGFCGLSSIPKCERDLGVGDQDNPNTLYEEDLDCGWPWPGHEDEGASKYQCRARRGLDGVSGVGTPNGSAAFKP